MATKLALSLATVIFSSFGQAENIVNSPFSFEIHRCERLRKRNLGQHGAGCKRTGTDVSHAFRNGQAGKLAAGCKRIRPNSVRRSGSWISSMTEHP